MIRRSNIARLLPGMWALVGGHVEASEIRTPQVACEREIFEETGLNAQDVYSLSLRYIVHRIRQNEIRIQFCYFGSTIKRELATTDEGELHWIPLDDVHNIAISATTRFTVQHYAKIGSQTSDIYVGSVHAQESNRIMTWSLLSDWE